MAARSPPLWSALLAAAGVLSASGAAADPTGATRLSYEAPADCPTEAEFVDALRRDGAFLAGTPPGGAARAGLERLIRIRIVQGEIVTGQVVARDPEREISRTVVGARCEDVVRALAVVVALFAESRPATSQSSAASSTTNATDTAATSRARSDAAPRPRPSNASAASPMGVVAATNPAEPSAILKPLPPGWRVGLAAEGTINGPGSVGLGVAAYLEVIRDVRDGFAPALRLGAELVRSTASAGAGEALAFGSAPAAPSNETAELTRRVVRLDACPVRAVAAPPWSPSPIEAWVCTRLDAGVLDAMALSLPDAHDMQRAWVAVGANAHVRWVLARFFLDLEGGMMFPLLRERFFVGPSILVYRVPVVTGAGGLALGAYFL